MTARGAPIVVYVPAPGHMLGMIRRASGIVGSPRVENNMVLIHYEEGTRKEPGIGTLADRVAHAHMRMASDVVTAASGWVRRCALAPVGTFDPERGAVLLTGPASERELAGWLNASHVAACELRCSGH